MRSFCLAAGLIFIVICANGQSAYYVERNGIVKAVTRGNPEREHPDEWRIRLYKPGAEKAGSGWGQIIGQSADDAREELQRSRLFWQRFSKFCRPTSQTGPQNEESFTYANALGPIAVYEKARPLQGKANRPDKKASKTEAPQNEGFDIADRISELEKDFLAVTEEKKVQANPSRYPFAPASAPWNFATKLAATKRQFEQLNAISSPASSGTKPSAGTSDSRAKLSLAKLKDALTDLETNLLPPMRKALANMSWEGKWKHGGMVYVAARSGNQLSFESADPQALRFRNLIIASDTALSGEIQFFYDNYCEPVWVHFTAALTLDTDAQGILVSAPRVGQEKSTCRQVTQGTLRMMFWRPEQ